MENLSFSDENVGWPSYVDFLCTFVFVLILFVGSLLYILSGDIRRREFQRKATGFGTVLREQGIAFAVDVEGHKVRLPLKGQVDFEPGESAILPRHVPYLRKIASILAQATGSKRIIVLGFADRTPFEGDPFGNWRLSAERALHVLQFFYNCHNCGYDVEIRKQLTLTGEGDIGASQTNVTNSEDRRVDIIIDFGAQDGR